MLDFSVKGKEEVEKMFILIRNIDTSPGTYENNNTIDKVLVGGFSQGFQKI